MVAIVLVAATFCFGPRCTAQYNFTPQTVVVVEQPMQFEQQVIGYPTFPSVSRRASSPTGRWYRNAPQGWTQQCGPNGCVLVPRGW